MAKTLFTDISELVTNKGVVAKNGARITEADLSIIKDGALLWDDMKGILWTGSTSELNASAKAKSKGAKKVSLKGKILTPALVDCHTHLVFAGSRHNELALRLQGATYQQIAAAGGGIASSVKATREASEKELYALAKKRVEAVLKLGVGVLEIKSGYGLDWTTELKILKVTARLKREFAKKITIQSTFLGAHAFPPGTKTDSERNQYVDEVTEKMLPIVAKQKLADACDVFFDEGYFTEDQSRRILTKAKELGLKIKLHADELADTGGAKLAAELNALSADHLLKVSDEGIQAMASQGVVAVLLPTTALYLGISYAPVDKLRAKGVTLALSTDFNPGSSPTLHLPFVMSLACFEMGMTMAEAFAAATFGGAKALGLAKTQGHLSVGSKPRMAIFDCPSYQALIAQMAHPSLCLKVI